jgi:hypothetical protein
MVVNKNTWHAHWHKVNKNRIWPEYKRQWEIETERFGTWYWMNDKWPLATRKMEWLVDRFMPLPEWPEDWREKKIEYEKKHPEFCGVYTIFDPDGNDGLPIKGE